MVIWIHTRGENEDNRSIFVRVGIDTLEGWVGRMNEVLVTIFVNYKVDKGRNDSISSDDLSDDKFSQAVAFLVPLTRKGFLLGVGRHIPLFPLFSVMNEGSNHVREVG